MILFLARFRIEASGGDSVLLAEVRESLVAHEAMPTVFLAQLPERDPFGGAVWESSSQAAPQFEPGPEQSCIHKLILVWFGLQPAPGLHKL